MCEDVTGSGEGVQWATDGGVGVRLNAPVPYWGQMASIHMIPQAGGVPLRMKSLECPEENTEKPTPICLVRSIWDEPDRDACCFMIA